jgi:hypothetical protein
MGREDRVTLFWLRVASLILWTVAAIVLAPSAYRYIRGEFRAVDEYRSAFFFTALLFVGSLSRWLIMPEDQQLFISLMVLTAVLGAYVILLASQGRMK